MSPNKVDEWQTNNNEDLIGKESLYSLAIDGLKGGKINEYK